MPIYSGECPYYSLTWQVRIIFLSFFLFFYRSSQIIIPPPPPSSRTKSKEIHIFYLLSSPPHTGLADRFPPPVHASGGQHPADRRADGALPGVPGARRRTRPDEGAHGRAQPRGAPGRVGEQDRRRVFIYLHVFIHGGILSCFFSCTDGRMLTQPILF